MLSIIFYTGIFRSDDVPQISQTFNFDFNL
jgi:hypothetical protein